MAVGEPTPTDPEAAHARGLLAALTADAYTAMNSPLFTWENLRCGTDACSAKPVVDLWGTDLGLHPVPACREHAVEALRRGARPSGRWFRR